MQKFELKKPPGTVELQKKIMSGSGKQPVGKKKNGLLAS
jgi:hypothetical protein